MSIDTTSEAAIFERIIRPEEAGITAEAAKSILAMNFNSEDIQRMDVLAEKARAGTLTAQEQMEIENYERVGHTLAILQSKARRALKRSATSNS